MVYYGIVSRGCERCRQRKVKCDQRKPECLKCEKSSTKCPGYRDLNDVVFRNESERVIQKFTTSDKSRCSNSQLDDPSRTDLAHESKLIHETTYHTPQTDHLSLSPKPLQLVDDLGVNFFFAKYSYSDASLFSGYHAWLFKSYYQSEADPCLRKALEAVGMAALSNVFYAPIFKSTSIYRSQEALAAIRHALRDPLKATADTTLVAVILLGLFELINFDDWRRFPFWLSRVEMAMALLKLRGEEQFTRQRGGHLYLHTRSDVLLACVQQRIAVPPSLVQATYIFQNSTIRNQWQQRNIASPGSITEISFRLINLRAARNRGQVKDAHDLKRLALEIDSDLDTWKTVMPCAWSYTTIETSDPEANFLFEGKNHVYPSLWIAEIWNNWRTLKILVNKLLLQNENCSEMPDHELQRNTISTIRQLSTELCISTYYFQNTSRMMTLMRPLYVVSRDSSNAQAIRAFAAEQLRRIDSSLGIRQARLLADTATTSILRMSKVANSVADDPCISSKLEL